jgi:hypothetical protein
VLGRQRRHLDLRIEISRAMMNMAASRPLTAKPTMLGHLVRSRMTPIRLKMKLAGVVVMMASPPRAPMGDPHPGLISSIRRNTSGVMNDTAMPMRPRVAWSLAGITGGTAGSGSFVTS